MWKKICSMAACALLLTPMAMAADSAVHELPYDSYVFSADGTPLELPRPSSSPNRLSPARAWVSAVFKA